MCHDSSASELTGYILNNQGSNPGMGTWIFILIPHLEDICNHIQKVSEVRHTWNFILI